MKQCSKCKRFLNESDFCVDSHKKDGLDCWCKDCRKLYRQKNRESIKRRHKNIRSTHRMELNELKTPCAKCGESRPYLIQFHHIDPTSKEFTIGHVPTYSLEHLIREVNKCVCLCANCHIEFHHIYGSDPKHPIENIEEYLKK